MQVFYVIRNEHKTPYRKIASRNSINYTGSRSYYRRAELPDFFPLEFLYLLFISFFLLYEPCVPKPRSGMMKSNVAFTHVEEWLAGRKKFSGVKTLQNAEPRYSVSTGPIELTF